MAPRSSSTLVVARPVKVGRRSLRPLDRSAVARLPAELWREIFVHATKIPDGYDSSYISPFDFSDITDGYKAFLRRLSQKHLLKKTLCLVSRTWHAIAQELMFEYLFLQDGFDWSTLASGLESSKAKDEMYAGRGAGWYVKRLEMSTSAWSPAKAQAAARVIRCCPNARVLTIGTTNAVDAPEEDFGFESDSGIPPEVVDAVFETCPRALRSLDWTSDLGTTQTPRMFRLLPQLHRLQALFMCAHSKYIVAPEQLKAVYDIELPSLHTLEIASLDHDPSCMLGIISHWKLPALRQVTFCGQRTLVAPSPFFAAHGGRLSAFEFDHLGTETNAVFKLCSNLTDIVVHLHYANSQLHGGHPRVERIGLRGLYLFDHGFNHQIVAMSALGGILPLFLDRKRFPSIKVVRLLDFAQSQFSDPSPRWRSQDVAFWYGWVLKFEREGVRLEDHEGNVISVVFSRVNVLLPEDIEPFIRNGRLTAFPPPQ